MLNIVCYEHEMLISCCRGTFHLHGKNDFAEVSKNLIRSYESQIILLDHNY